MDLLTALGSGGSVFAAELRPPRAELATVEGMDAWIDTYHAVQRLTRQGTYVFLTDSAVGAQEEDNLRHLVTNLGNDVPRERIVPFLTAKHSLEYCLSYAERAQQNGFPALVVLGGDKAVGRAALRSSTRGSCAQLLRQRDDALDARRLGEPARRRRAAGGLSARPDFNAEFYLTQVVSHHHADAGRAFHRRRRAARPGAAGGLRRLLLSQRQPAHARRAEGLPAGAGRGAHARVRGRRDAGGHVRADDPHADGRRRPPLLHQQPAGREGAGRRSPTCSRKSELSRRREGWRAGKAEGPTRRVGGHDEKLEGQLACGSLLLPSSDEFERGRGAQSQTPLQRLRGVDPATTRSIVQATWAIDCRSRSKRARRFALDADQQMEMIADQIPLMVEALSRSRPASSSWRNR